MTPGGVATRAMLPLPELQARFAAALRADAEAPVDAALLREIRADGLEPAARLDIYRNNLRGNFLKVLALEFPAIRRLGGADWFAQCGLDFLRAHPSRSGDLHGLGAPFAAFLAQRLHGGRHAYFADVAALEWAWQESLVAADAAAQLDVAALAGVAAEQVVGLRFTMHPALRLVRSRWPTFTIWNANRDDAVDAPDGARDAAAPIDLDAGGQCVIVRRSGEGAEARCCDAATYEWLAALAAGARFGAAWDAAAAVEPRFDVARTLATAVALELVTAFGE
jgi:Putative DNA-binding domain